jgi:hypothetical protein
MKETPLEQFARQIGEQIDRMTPEEKRQLREKMLQAARTELPEDEQDADGHVGSFEDLLNLDPKEVKSIRVLPQDKTSKKK